jgi:hypothetical protein
MMAAVNSIMRNNTAEIPMTDEKGKNKKKGLKALIAAALLTVLIAAAVLTVVKNLFGGRDMIIKLLASFDPAYETLAAWEARLVARESELGSIEEGLAKRESDLARAQAEFDGQVQAREQEETESSFELFIGSLSEERIEQFVQLGAIYSNMDAEQAAAALSEMESEMDIAVVLYFMKPESSAAALGRMEPKLAAAITESLLK